MCTIGAFLQKPAYHVKATVGSHVVLGCAKQCIMLVPKWHGEKQACLPPQALWPKAV